MDTTLIGHRQAPRFETVSFDDEDLILVDEHDRITGYDSKINTHAGAGKLHRAFSVFLFDGPDWVLLQQRAEAKPLWPGYWANSCCSHPRRGESTDAAAVRRLDDELGVSTELDKIYTFRYRATYQDQGTEHELCSVYVGQYARHRELDVNREEISEWGWFSRQQVDLWVSRQRSAFAPWFLLEWEQLKRHGTRLAS
jgi:isopentenyl-diphosphate delta-isomerase